MSMVNSQGHVGAKAAPLGIYSGCDLLFLDAISYSGGGKAFAHYERLEAP